MNLDTKIKQHVKLRVCLGVLFSLGWIYLLMHTYEDESQFNPIVGKISDKASSTNSNRGRLTSDSAGPQYENRKVASYRESNDLSPQMHKTEGGYFYQGILKASGEKVGPLTTERTFFQYFEGMRVYPKGILTQKWSKSGEFLEEYADLNGKIEILNQRKLSSVNATSKLSNPTAVQPILWVIDGKGYYAYSVESDYHRVIIDAQSGETLDKKDLRVH